MEASSVSLILFGGGVSLASSLATTALSHLLEIQRRTQELKQHPLEALYDKQTHFIDTVVPILDEINGYLAGIDVWLNEPGPGPRKTVAKLARENKPVADLHKILERYFAYLPQELLDQANTLFVNCLDTSANPTRRRVAACFDLLFAFQNSIRTSVGTKPPSRDLLRAFGRRTTRKVSQKGKRTRNEAA